MAEMMGLRGVSSYSRASSAYNAIGILLFAFSIFLNAFFIKEVYETKRQMAYIKVQAKDVEILKSRLVEKEAALQALSEALSMFVPEDAAERFKRHKQKMDADAGEVPSVGPSPENQKDRQPQRMPAKPTALPTREQPVSPEKKYL